MTPPNTSKPTQRRSPRNIIHKQEDIEYEKIYTPIKLKYSDQKPKYLIDQIIKKYPKQESKETRSKKGSIPKRPTCRNQAQEHKLFIKDSSSSENG